MKQLRKFDPYYFNGSTSGVQEQAGSNPSTPIAPTQRFTAFPVDVSSQPDVAPNNPTSRPPGTKKQKRAKNSGISQESFDAGCSKSAEFVEAYKQSQSSMATIGTNNQENMQHYIQVKKKQAANDELKNEMQIMGMITRDMPTPQRIYWENLQREVCLKKGVPWP